MLNSKRSLAGGAALSAAIALLLLPTLAPIHALGAVPEGEILTDSAVSLVERPTYGSYRSLTVTLETRNGASTLIASRDGVETRVAIPASETLALWRALQASGIGALGDSSDRGLPPDQSYFTVTFRTPSGSNAFSVYGVDSLADGRYRAIVREILHLADSRAYGKAWRK